MKPCITVEVRCFAPVAGIIVGVIGDPARSQSEFSIRHDALPCTSSQVFYGISSESFTGVIVVGGIGDPARSQSEFSIHHDALPCTSSQVFYGISSESLTGVIVVGGIGDPARSQSEFSICQTPCLSKQPLFRLNWFQHQDESAVESKRAG